MARPGGSHLARSQPRAVSPGRTIRRFIVRFALTWTLAYMLLVFLPGIESAVQRATTVSVGLTLRMAQVPVEIRDATLNMDGVTFEVIPECTSLIASILLLSAMVSFPTAPRVKALGVVAGLTGLWLYNMLRVMVLLGLAVHDPDLFSFIHLYLSQAVTLVFVWALFVTWLRVAVARAGT